MAVSKDEHLSALVDDEAGDFERRRLTDELINSEDDRGRWSRYHLIGDVMRGDVPAVIDTGFAARVSAAIAEEAMDAQPASLQARRMTRPVVGFAMAASVAVATVLGVQGLMGPSEGPTDGAATLSAQAPAVMPEGVRQVAVTRVPLGTGATTDAQRATVNLNSYIVRHTEYATQHGMLPQARVVGYTAQGE
ncbi:MAG TPA: anti-sigma 24 factor [Thioalkalivibrio sp.]|nr:anti-sigma 24 factor [Thioalkalivibrio sp.]